MTRVNLRKLMDRVFDGEICKLREEGQKEYAHDEENAFANFERVAADLGIDRKAVLWTYLRKHMDGITAYIRGHKSQREDVRGRINDAIVYLFLLRGMIEEEETVQTDQIEFVIDQSVDYYEVKPSRRPKPKVMADLVSPPSATEYEDSVLYESGYYDSKTNTEYFDPQTGEPLAPEFGGISHDSAP